MSHFEKMRTSDELTVLIGPQVVDKFASQTFSNPSYCFDPPDFVVSITRVIKI